MQMTSVPMPEPEYGTRGIGVFDGYSVESVDCECYSASDVRKYGAARADESRRLVMDARSKELSYVARSITDALEAKSVEDLREALRNIRAWASNRKRADLDAELGRRLASRPEQADVTG